MDTVKTSGFRSAWFSAVTVLLMDGGDTPPSIERLVMTAGRRVGPTARNDGYVTARNNGADGNDYQAGWKIIIEELVSLLREHGYIDSDLRWIGPTSGKITWGGKKYSIRPADERQASRDYSMVMLGSRADYGTVQIEGARGGITKRQLEVHPIADMLPLIPADELARLRADIEQNGVLTPLLVYEGKVLDGRHRLYLAAKLDAPIRLEEFEGTEQEARARVGSLNLLRRHLTVPQRAQLAIDLYQTEAEKEAKRAHAEAVRKTKVTENTFADLRKSDRPKHTSEIVSQKTSGAVRPRAIEAMQVVQKAPETLSKVRTGEIKTITGAEKAAREELGKKAPAKVDPWSKTINTELGRSLAHLRTVAKELDLDLGAEPTQIKDRLDEIENGVREVRETLKQRGVL